MHHRRFAQCPSCDGLQTWLLDVRNGQRDRIGRIGVPVEGVKPTLLRHRLAEFFHVRRWYQPPCHRICPRILRRLQFDQLVTYRNHQYRRAIIWHRLRHRLPRRSAGTKNQQQNHHHQASKHTPMLHRAASDENATRRRIERSRQLS